MKKSRKLAVAAAITAISGIMVSIACFSTMELIGAEHWLYYKLSYMGIASIVLIVIIIAVIIPFYDLAIWRNE